MNKFINKTNAVKLAKRLATRKNLTRGLVVTVIVVAGFVIPQTGVYWALTHLDTTTKLYTQAISNATTKVGHLQAVEIQEGKTGLKQALAKELNSREIK